MCEPVDGDGHCGYRSIAYLRNYEKLEGWKIVRGELLEEMMANQWEYKAYFGFKRFEELRKNLECTIVAIRRREYWFDLPDMGDIVANVCLSCSRIY